MRRIIPYVRALTFGQLATLWAAGLLLAGAFSFYWARTGGDNAGARVRFDQQLAEYRTQLATYSAEARAYRDSASDLGTLTAKLRRARAVRPDVLEANDAWIRSYLDRAKTVQIEVDLYRRLVELHETSGATSLRARQRTRITLGRVALAMAFVIAAGVLTVTWWWFDTHKPTQRGVAV